jgi:hypothetical protein
LVVLTSLLGLLVFRGVVVAGDQTAPAAVGSAAVEWSFGWDGLVTLGSWTAATVEFELPHPATCRLEISTLDAEGHTATYVGKDSDLESGRQRLTHFFQVQRVDSTIKARLMVNDARHSETVIKPGESPHVQPLARRTDTLIVTVGCPETWQEWLSRPANSASEAAVRIVARSKPADLPATARSFESVHWVILAGAEPVPQEVSEALRQWVADGGRLVISLPKPLDAFQASSLRSWLPVEVEREPVMIRELGDLERFAGLSMRIPTTGREPAARLRGTAGKVLAASRDDPLLYRAPYGFGEVHVLALDVTQPPLSRWRGLRELAHRLVELSAAPAIKEAAPPATRITALTSTGISDLASQWQAALDHFSAVQRPTPSWSMAWVLILILLVGPLDYLVVHQLLRRPQATWLTLPLCLLIVGVLAARAAGSWNGRSARAHQLDVLDVDAGSGRFRCQTWINAYSSETVKDDLRLKPPEALWGAPLVGERRVAAWATPEPTAGGMYRSGGTEWGRTVYHVYPDDQRLTALPILQWSSRAVTGEEAGWVASLPVESKLESTGPGRLTGTLTHFFPGELTDWILAYGTRVYRRQPGREEETSLPWPPNEVLSLDDRLVYQRDLKGMLTGVVIRRDQREGRAGSDVRMSQTPYDPLHREWLSIWEMVTFHEAAGGKGYTRLTNQLLSRHDLSRLLDLERAVLFGRLRSSPGHAIERNGQQVTPDRRETLVRVVLPVRRTVDIIRELPDFKKLP